MDFSPTEASTDLATLTRDILTRSADPWPELAKAGVLSAALPEAVGGGGFGLVEQCAVLVEMGRAVAAVPYLWSIAVCAPVAGDDWARRAAAGDVVLTAALDDPLVQASRTADGWRLTGSKNAVPYAPVADAVLLPTDDGVFLATADEVTVTPQELVDFGSAGWVDVDVEVPAGRRLGGTDVAERMSEAAAVGLCAVQVGVLERALELTAEHARTRVQFGRPIATFQAVAQRLADAYVDVEAARLTMWQAMWRVSAGLPAAAEVATAKFWAADAGHRVAHTAVHVHGGMGIDMDHPLHRYFIAAKRNEFELGGATDWLRRLGGLLADEPA
ncbi:MAG TPA: acyl-CoA dehydrogenase family protein [Pseudonocardiaceae bacterium]|jgi:acyl-CoA dehydrogenase|nr:acyl-CoA dehydrogenase family protein [Pseudonocardiaceae bacterium]